MQNSNCWRQLLPLQTKRTMSDGENLLIKSIPFSCKRNLRRNLQHYLSYNLQLTTNMVDKDLLIKKDVSLINSKPDSVNSAKQLVSTSNSSSKTGTETDATKFPQNNSVKSSQLSISPSPILNSLLSLECMLHRTRKKLDTLISFVTLEFTLKATGLPLSLMILDIMAAMLAQDLLMRMSC